MTRPTTWTAIALATAAMLAVTACAGPGGGEAQKGSVTVFAASSLQPAFNEIGKRVDLGVTFNFAGSQTLTAQIMQGAQADVFASADTDHMASLQNAGLLDSTPQVFAHNRLEIAVAKGNPKKIHSLADLARPGVVVVLADPSVPAGKYAQQALATAGVTVKPASLELQVSAVLSKVALGEADAGIVYVSDVTTSGQVDGVPIAGEDNVIADYPIAIVKGARDRAAAQTFVSFVLSAEGQSLLADAGFEKA